MHEVHIAKSLLTRVRNERPAGWYEVWSPCVVREQGGAIVVDADHPASAEAALRYGALFGWNSFAGLWFKLHRRPLECVNIEEEGKWLAKFSALITCPECTSHWKQILKDNHPDFNLWSVVPNGRREYAEWTWRVHNLVNLVVPKRKVSWDEAVEIHGWHSINLCEVQL